MVDPIAYSQSMDLIRIKEREADAKMVQAEALKTIAEALVVLADAFRERSKLP
jgi:hypothetical protein